MIKVENVNAFQEDGEWFLKIVAKEVLDNKTYEVAIPKLRLPIENFRIVGYQYSNKNFITKKEYLEKKEIWSWKERTN